MELVIKNWPVATLNHAYRAKGKAMFNSYFIYFFVAAIILIPLLILKPHYIEKKRYYFVSFYWENLSVGRASFYSCYVTCADKEFNFDKVSEKLKTIDKNFVSLAITNYKEVSKSEFEFNIKKE